MILTKKLEGTTLTVNIEGRLDTLTAPELETALEDNYLNLKKVVLDLKKLEYISSAGLRVILGAQKKMTKQDGSMEVIHVSEMVMDVFEVTGFADIINIR